MKNALLLLLLCAPSHALVSRVSPRIVRPASFGGAISLHTVKTDALKPLAGLTRFTPVLQVGTPVPQPVSFANGTKIAALTQTEHFSRASNEALGGAGRTFFDQAASLNKENDEPVEASNPAPEKKKLPLGVRLKRAAMIGAFGVLPAYGIAKILLKGDLSHDWPTIVGIGVPAVLFWLVVWFNTWTIGGIVRDQIEKIKKFLDEKGPELLKIPGVKSIEAIAMTDKQRDTDYPTVYLVLTVDHLGPDNDKLLPELDYRAWSPAFRDRAQFIRMGQLEGWPAAIKLAK